MNRIKKLLLIGLCVAFLFGITVHAEGNTEFHVENQTGKAGDVVTVPVQFNTGQEVGGFQISIFYDSETMEFESLEKGDLIIENGGGIFDYNHIAESSEIIVVYVVADTVKDEGVIVNLQFKLKQDCGEQLPIAVGVDQLVDNSEESAAITGEVSGVDEAFQAQVMEQTGGNTVVAEGNGANWPGLTDSGASGDAESEASEGGSSDPAAETENENTSEDETSAAEQSEQESGGNADENSEQQNPGSMGIVIAAVVVVVIAAAGTAVYFVRKRKK